MNKRTKAIARDLNHNLVAEWAEFVKESPACETCQYNYSIEDKFICSIDDWMQCPVMQDHVDGLIALLEVVAQELDSGVLHGHSE
jgi:hypothetical protein